MHEHQQSMYPRVVHVETVTMAATVSALIEVLEKTCPPNAKWNVKTEMPQDPEVNQKLQDLKEQPNGDPQFPLGHDVFKQGSTNLKTKNLFHPCHPRCLQQWLYKKTKEVHVLNLPLDPKTNYL